MKKTDFVAIGLVLSIFTISGCTVRTYQLTRDRIDQDLSSGNRGYLKGNPPLEEKERKSTRTTQVVEVEIGSPMKFEKKQPVKKTSAADEEIVGNRGYLTESQTPESAEISSVSFEKYTVQKGDTLQKISKKFYGTTKKWQKIFDANRETLKSPDKLYVGQTIDIPVEGMQEPAEKLK